MRIRVGELWRHSNFLKLWTAESISVFGTTISTVALPLVAILTLNASAGQMGILKALSSAPVLLFGLFMGVWIDRGKRQLLMIATQFGYGILLALIPIAAVFGVLRIELLYCVNFFSGTLLAIYILASASFLPSIVNPDTLVEANSKLSAGRSVSKIAGPGLGGALIESLTAPITILLDVFSSLMSAVNLLFIRSPESVEVEKQKHGGMWRDIGDGLRTIFFHPILRPVTIGPAIGSFGGAIHSTVYLLYLTRELRIAPTSLGIILSCEGIAALVGATIVGSAARRYRPGLLLISAPLFQSVGLGLVPFAGMLGVWVIPILIVATSFSTGAFTVYNITQLSLRQAVTPDELLGRVNASWRVLVGGVIPLGAVIGGVMGESIGLQRTLVGGAFVTFIYFVFHLCSPLRHISDFGKMSKSTDFKA